MIKSLGEKKDIDVLLIEDNSDDADIIKINLEKSKFPYEVDVGDTGKIGLDKLKEKHYDIIVVDYILPDMTGIKLIEEIKKRNISTPIIMLTGVDEREIAVSIMKLGASDYLVKSTELYKNLPDIISKILKNNWQYSETFDSILFVIDLDLHPLIRI